MDKINIKNLEIFAKHGVYPEENTLGQKFVVSAALSADLRPAGKSDNISLSLDYSRICGVITDYVVNNTFKLIETVAEGLAETLLLENPVLKKVWIEIKKPWAALNVQLETVSVEMERSRHTVFIALGSNMGDREAYLKAAVDGLGAAHGCRVMSVSSFIETEPYGFTEQDNFLNGCLELETLMTPHELLSLLHGLERSAGRERTVRWGPRTLDLDIIFYDDLIMSDGALRLPHNEVHKRDFVLIPLCEIAPAMLHPVYGKTVEELLAELKNT